MSEEMSQANQEYNEPQIQQEVTSEPQETQQPSIEDEARAQGWNPEGEFSAEEYVRRGSLFKKIHSQTAQIRELKDTLTKLADHVETSEKAGYERALLDISARRDNAILSGDLDTVRSLDKQAEIIKDKQAAPVIPQSRQFTADEIEFAERNKNWFNDRPENSEMVHSALTFDNYLVQNRPDLDSAGRLKIIEDKLRKLHPDKFTNPKKNLPGSVASSSNSRDGRSVNLISRLSPQQRAIGEQFQRLVPGYSIEKYAKELEKQGNLGK